MNKFLQNKYSLSPEGARKMSRGVIYSALLNISFMLPMLVVFTFLDESLNIYKFHTQVGYTSSYYILLVPLTVICIYFARIRVLCASPKRLLSIAKAPIR